MEEKETLENRMIDDADQTDFESQPELEDIPEPIFKRTDSVYLPSEPPRSSNKLVVIILALLFLLVIGLGVFVIVSLPRQLEKEIAEITEAQSESGTSFWDALIPDKENSDNVDSDNVDSDNVDSDNVDSDIVDSDNEDSEYDFDGNLDSTGIVGNEKWTKQFINHSPEEFQGPYYENITDCIDETVSYKVNRQFYAYEKEEDNICIRVSYIQLEGDIPNIDSINEQLKEVAFREVRSYESDPEFYIDMVRDSDEGYRLEAYEYVTYNDEEKISIVLEENLTECYALPTDLWAFNINIGTGTILDNTRILRINEDFTKEFMKRSEKQNGSDPIMDMMYRRGALEGFLENNSNMVLFYTPIGMEVGCKYIHNQWVTISMEDYKQYLRGRWW